MIKQALIALVRTYQKFISPAIGGRHRCRFFPRCSDYAIEALGTHGTLKGSLLAARRILKCNPLFRGGYDPVSPSVIPAQAGIRLDKKEE